MIKRFNLRTIVSLLVAVFIVQNVFYTNVSAGGKKESQDDIENVLAIICNSEMHNGDEIVTDDGYTIVCEEYITDVPSIGRNAYSVTKSATKTFKVAQSDKQVFTVTQNATAVFNTYTQKVKISSHTAKFTPIDSSYFLVSSRQAVTLNTWGDMVPGRVEMTIGQGSSTGMLFAYVTVFNNGTFKFNFSQAW